MSAYWRQSDCDKIDYSYDSDDSEHVTFYRPDGDTEGKDKDWCRSHGFYQIKPGLWSGDWYWTHFPGAKRRLAQKQEERKKRLEADNTPERQRERMAEVKVPRQKCLVKGCPQLFPTMDDMEWHVITSKGKAHQRYRESDDCCHSVKRKFKIINEPPIMSTKCNWDDLRRDVIDQIEQGYGRLYPEDAMLIEDAQDVLYDVEQQQNSRKILSWIEAVNGARARALAYDSATYMDEREAMRCWLYGE